MNIDDLQDAVEKWAATEPLVRRIYLFGSRARGTNKPDSDIDLAVVHNIDGFDRLFCTDARARQMTWMRHKQRWGDELRPLLKFEPDINEVSRESSTIWHSLKECRVCLYNRRTPFFVDPKTAFIYHNDKRPWGKQMPNYAVACQTRPVSLMVWDRSMNPDGPPLPLFSWAVQDKIEDIGLPNNTYIVLVKAIEIAGTVALRGRTRAHVEKARDMLLQMAAAGYRA